MAAPLSGVGQQQVPISQPFQPGGSDQTREIRQRNQEPRENELQARGAAPAQTQETNSGEKSAFQQNVDNARAGGNHEQASAQGRGTVIDIIV